MILREGLEAIGSLALEAEASTASALVYMWHIVMKGCLEFGTFCDIMGIFDAAIPMETAGSPAPSSVPPAAAPQVLPPRFPAPAASSAAGG